ncbi:hypothetical protein Dalk_3904 [Desulfatibacillum aliphaticivorans]|uniref:Right handed beta helix domain-containing protein n=1 Tax=Desulfatibacillum aliphaticivorans TaxID=218208 RepID=B8FJC1_DESAL|nr:right-handed parallel beta-helix repeat-containing protein [Desulfatibacillum aliphaticivorans]ACL05590.1 hypothetical protein Dalk_3904 [Desulfatibacillum aliphaticivorans]
MNSTDFSRATLRAFASLAVIALAMVFFPAQGFCDYYTPGGGTTYTLDQLVGLSGGVVTGESPYYQLNEDLIINEGDALNISPAVETVLFISDNVTLVISGTLQVQGTEEAPVGFTGGERKGAGVWDSIYVTGNGSVNMSYAQVFGAECGLYLVDIAPTAPGSVVDHCTFKNCEWPGIELNNYDAPSFTLTNSVLAQNGEDGLTLEGVWQSAVTVAGNWFHDNGWAGIFVYEGSQNLLIQGNAFTSNANYGIEAAVGGPNMQVLNNLIYDTYGTGIALNTGSYYLNKDETDFYTAGEQAVIQSNVIIGSQDEGIYSYYSSGHNISNNVIADNAAGIYLENSWNDLVAVNTIGECTLDDSLFSLDSLDLPFSYGDLLEVEVLGGPLDDRDVEANAGPGIVVEDSIPGLGAEPAEYGWIEVNTTNADNWAAYQEPIKQDEDLDDYPMEEAAIGFDFPVSYTAATGVEYYTHFSMTSNGIVELAAQQYGTEGIWDYESRGYFTNYYSEYTLLFANSDDWVDTGDAVYETHNGQQVRMNGFGYRHFQAGDVDGDGKTVPEECLVLRWYMQHWVDAYYAVGAAPIWNDFQVIIYPDGRIRWNNKAENAHGITFSNYCGLYAGYNETPFEIMAVNDPQSKTSYLFDPAKARKTTNQILGNTMINNAANVSQPKAPIEDGDDIPFVMTGGTCLYNALFVDMRSNTIESDVTGLQLNGGSPLSPTVNFNNITSYGDYERRAPLSTWRGVSNNTGYTVDALYNYWETDVPGSYMNGLVDIDPWLTSAVPDPEESGILLYYPFNVDSNGAVITVTSGLYPGMSLVFPQGAVDYQEEPLRKAGSITVTPGITFTVGELLPEPALPSYIQGVGKPFVFTPSGQTFSTPITITMPYKGYTAPTLVYYFDTVSLTWKTDGITVVSVNEKNRTVTFTTTHFTVFAAGLTKSSGGGDDDNPPYHYHRGEWNDDHFVDCFVDSLGGAGSLPFIPAALAMLLAALGLRRKQT